MPNITIGDGAIIGARAVVTKDVEPFTIVAGNPARIIRKRFSEEEIAQLLQIQWWNWDYDRIIQNLKAIMSADIKALQNAKKTCL